MMRRRRAEEKERASERKREEENVERDGEKRRRSAEFRGRRGLYCSLHLDVGGYFKEGRFKKRIVTHRRFGIARDLELTIISS